MASPWDGFVSGLQQALDPFVPDSAETIDKAIGTMFSAPQEALRIGGNAALTVADKVTPDPYKTEMQTFPTPGTIGRDFVPRYETIGRQTPNLPGQIFGRATSPITGTVKNVSTALTLMDRAISEPGSVIIQAAYAGNPLYKDGIQVNDFLTMMKTAESFSPGNSLMWRESEAFKTSVFGSPDLTSMGMGLMPRLLLSNFEPATTDIYDPKVRKDLADDTLWSIGSGINDVAYQVTAGALIDKGVLKAAKAVGVSSRIEDARDLGKVTETFDKHITFVETQGAEGSRSVLGRHLETIADSTSAAAISSNPLVRNSPAAIQIGSILQDVTDLRTIAKVVLADHGDRAAIASLLRDDPDWAWEMANMNLRTQLQTIAEGAPVRVTPDNAQVYARVYDSALNRPGNEFYQSVRDMFLSTADNGRTLSDDAARAEAGLYDSVTVNNVGMPASGAAAAVDNAVSSEGFNIRMGYGLAQNLGDGWAATVLGNIGGSKPVTVIAQYVGGRRPQGFLAFNNFEPTNAVDEIVSTAGLLKWTRGNREFTFVRNGQEVTMSGTQWREDAITRLSYASRQGDQAVLAEQASLEAELISSVIQRFGLTSTQAAQLAETAVRGKNANVANLREVGFFFDDSANMVRVSADLRRQLVDSYVMFPIADFAREARAQFGNGKFWVNFRHGFDQFYEFIQKYMRTQQLIKPAYLRNSVLEPAGSMLVNLGIDQVGSLTWSAAHGLKNFYINRARQLGGAVLSVSDRVGVGTTFRLTAKSRVDRQVIKLHEQRIKLEDELAQLESGKVLGDAGELSPATAAHMQRVYDGASATARARLQAIYRELDLSDSGWRDAVPNANFSALRQEVNELNQIIDDPEVVTKLRSQLESETARAEGVHARDVEVARAQLLVVDRKIADAERQLALPNNDDLVATAAAAESRNRDIRNLRYLEQRLAWAEDAVAGKLDLNAGARKRIEDRLTAFRIERERLASAVDTEGDQMVLTGEGRKKTEALAELDRVIMRLEDDLKDLQVEQLPAPQMAQEIVDTYPAQIENLRVKLGDLSADNKEALDGFRAVEAEFTDEIAAVQQRTAEVRKTYGAQISEIRKDLPKVRKTDDPEAMQDWEVVIPDDEQKLLREQAAAEVEQSWDEIADIEDGFSYAPDWIEPYLSASDLAIYQKTGLIPLSVVRKFFGAEKGQTLDLPGGKKIRAAEESFNSWFEFGNPDIGYLSKEMPQYVAPNRGLGEYEGMVTGYVSQTPSKAKSRPWISSEEIKSVLDGEVTGTEALELLRARKLSPAQADAARRLGYNVRAASTVKRKNDGSTGRQFIRVPWADRFSTEAKQRKIDDLFDDKMAESEAAYSEQYAEGIAKIDDLTERMQGQIADNEGFLATLRDGLRTEVYENPEYLALNGKRPLPTLTDPSPSPFDRAQMRSEVERLRKQREQLSAAAERPFTPNSRLVDLQARVDRAERLMASDPSVRAEIAALRELMLDSARANVNVGPVVSPAKVREQLAERITAINEKIGVLQESVLPATMRRQRLKERLRAGQGETTVTTNQGTRLTGDDIFSGSDFGTARRKLFSAGYTSRATLDPTESGAANARALGLSNGSVTVMPSDPRWMDELVYVTNRHVVGDELATLILSGASNQRIGQWLTTPAGKKYMKDMGWSLDDLRPTIVNTVPDQWNPGGKVPVWDNGQINDIRNILFSYYPTQASRDAVLAGEVSSEAMTAAFAGVPMAGRSPIQGRMLEQSLGGLAATRTRVRNGINKLWDLLATKPEDVIRGEFAGREYRAQLTARLNILESQGVKLSASEWNAVKQAAIADTLREARKTFYNVVRYNNIVYAMRYLFVYPQAIFNSLYRAARLTVKRPGSAMVVNNAWTEFFSTNAFDKDGNKTDDYFNAETVAFELPWSLRDKAAEWGMDDRLQFSVRANELLSDKIGASWTITIPAQTLLMHKPDVNTDLREIVGEDVYRSLFPFGTPSGLSDLTIAGVIPAGSLVPGYVKSLARSLIVRDDEFLRISTQIFEHDAANQARLGGDDYTSPVDAAVKARKYLLATALVQSMFSGGATRVAGQVELDGIRRILARNGNDREKALPEIMQAYPDIDPIPYLQSTSEYSTYVPSTVDAFRVIDDAETQELIGSITREGNGDPEMVEVLVADKTGKFDANVYDALGNIRLPGSTAVIRSKPDTVTIEGRIEAQKSWDVYNAARANFDAEMIRLDRKTYPDWLQDEWNEWFNEWIDQPENKVWYAQWSKRDDSQAKRAVDALQRGLEDPSMAKYREGSIYWKVTEAYLAGLANFVTAYRNADSSEARAALKEEWAGVVATEFAAVSPEFGRIYNKFLADYDLEIRGGL